MSFVFLPLSSSLLIHMQVISGVFTQVMTSHIAL